MSGAASPADPLPGENWTLRIPLADLEDTADFAHRLSAQLQAGDLLVLTGGLGAGKTTFTQALGQALGVQGPISSPTFILSRIHPNDDGPDLVHVDAYRTDAEGLESLDLPATQSDSVTVVEWGRGLVEDALAGPGGSWLDIELLTQQDPSASAAADAAPRTPETSDQADGAIRTDFSETEEDLLGTPRTVVLRGYGPRWQHPPLPGS